MPVFKGTKSFFSYDATDILRYNLDSWLEWGLLEIGAYETADKDGRNSELATLQSVKDERETDGTVYEAYGPSLVWQSGVSPIAESPSIINPSGIWIDGSFIPNGTTGPSGFFIDYRDGRVVFEQAQSGVVQMNYSFPHVAVYDSKSPQWKDIIDSYDINEYGQIGTTSPSGVASNLKERRVWLPCVVVEVQDRTNNNPLQLGGGEIHDYAVFYHVFGNRDFDVVRICDLLNNQKSKQLKLFDVNKASASGVIPYNYNGSVPSGVLEYETLRGNNNGYFWTYGRIEESRGGSRSTFTDIYRGEVIQSVTVYRYPSTY